VVISATRSPFRRLFVDAFLPAMILMTAGCGGGEEAASETPASTAPAEGGAAAMPGSDPAAMGAAAMPGMQGMAAAPANPGMTPPGGASSSDSGSSGYAAAPPSGADAMAGYAGAAGMMPPGGNTAAPGTTQPQIPSRPLSVSEWTDEQLVDAVHDRDPQVLEAIDSRVKSSPGDPKVAELLTSLLTALANPRVKPAQNMQGGAPGYNAEAGAAYPSTGYNASSGAAAPGMVPGATPAANPNPASPATLSPGAGTSSDSSSSGASAVPGAAVPTLQAAPPSQSSIRHPHHESLAVDSISMMFLESATTYQGGAVGAMSAKNIPGAVGTSSSAESSSGAAQASSGAAMVPGAGVNYSAAPAMNTAGGEYPGGGYQASGVMPGQGGTGAGGLAESLLIEKIVEALIRNGSPAAWQSIYGIASQTVKTPLPPGVGAEIVAHGLYRNIDSNPAMIEPILLSLIDGSAQLPPESRSAALRVTAEISGLAADKLTGFPTIAPAAGSGQFGMAGMSGAGAAGMPAASMTAMPGGAAAMTSGAGALAGSSGAAEMEAYSGMQNGAMPGAGMAGAPPGAANAPGKPVISDAALMRAASFLWGPKCVDALVKQLEASSDIGIIPGFVGGGDFVRIAASVPNDRVRKSLADLFEKAVPASVGQLGMTGFFSTSVHDPGMLIAVKSLPRTKPSRTEAAQGVPLDAWATASLDVVLSLRDRLRVLSATPGRLMPVSENLPIRLHKNAVAEFYGVMTLPGTAGATLKESAPAATKIYYARTSFSPEKPKDQQDLAEHYESRANGIKRVSEAKGVLLWVDGFKATQTGGKRTADVLVTSSAGGGGGVGGAAMGGSGESGAPGIPAGYGGAVGGGAGGAFTIEIIVVETIDAKASAAGGEKTESANKR
jgi:hypothetical protein